MKLPSESVLSYFLAKQGLAVTAEKIAKLDAREFAIMVTGVCSTFPALLMVAVHTINLFGYKFGPIGDFMLKDIFADAMIVTNVLFMMYLVLQFVRMWSMPDYQLVDKAYSCLKVARKQFIHYFGRKPLNFDEASQTKESAETKIVEGMKLILVIVGRGRYQEEVEMRRSLLKQYNAAKPFCPISSYEELFGRASTELSKTRLVEL